MKFRTQNPWLLAAGAGQDVGRTYANTLVDIARIKAAEREAQANRDIRQQEYVNDANRWERQFELQQQGQRLASQREARMQRELDAQTAWRNTQQDEALRARNDAAAARKGFRYWVESGAQPQMLSEMPEVYDAPGFKAWLAAQPNSTQQSVLKPDTEIRLQLALQDQAQQLGKVTNKRGALVPAPLSPVFNLMSQATAAGIPNTHRWANTTPSQRVTPGYTIPDNFLFFDKNVPPTTNTLSGSINTNAIQQALMENPELMQYLLQQNGINISAPQVNTNAPTTNAVPMVGKYKILGVQ